MGKRWKLVTIVGARPQFIKASVVSRAIAGTSSTRRIWEILVHTGQHYEARMSDVFFRSLRIPKPQHHLGLGGGSHAQQTGRMLPAIEEVLAKEKPHGVLVYGDTNSTLAGALAAAKMDIPIYHVESGLRSYDRRMPEEINRVVTDHLAGLLLCPTRTAVLNLGREGIRQGVALTGDVMFDLIRQASLSRAARGRSQRLLAAMGISSKRFLLVTVHRTENTDSPRRMENLLRVLESFQEDTVLPLHPRTRQRLEEYEMMERLRGIERLRVVEPFDYPEMIILQREARRVLTDSGGVQKEAYLLGTPCITLRPRTEWVETLQGGWNILTHLDFQAIRLALRSQPKGKPRCELFGDGNAGKKIVRQIEKFFCNSSAICHPERSEGSLGAE